MSCRKYQRLLNLYRPGELSTREQAELDTHLSVCPSCAEEWREIQAIENRMEALRQEVPSVADPQGMTENILTGIRDELRPLAQPIIEAAAGVLNRLFRPALPRRAAVAVCFGLVCLFLAQQVSMLHEVRGLERRLSRTPYAAAGFDLDYIVPREAWEELETDLGNGVAREAVARFLQRKENRILLARRPLRRLMVKYRDRPMQRAWVFARLLEQHPDLRDKLEPLRNRKSPQFRPWFNLQQYRRQQP